MYPNEISLNFEGHINVVTYEEIENIKNILSEFIENTDISNKITSYDGHSISHDLFISNLKNSEISYLKICYNIARLNWHKKQIKF